MADWRKIKAEYIRGGVSYRELAARYEVSFSQLQKIGAKEKWTDLRKKAERKSEEKLVNSVADQEARRAGKLLDTTEKLLNKIARQIAESDGLAPQDLSAYAIALERLKRIFDIKSSIDIAEQQARIEKLHKEARTEEESKDIQIVFRGALDDYSR